MTETDVELNSTSGAKFIAADEINFAPTMMVICFVVEKIIEIKRKRRAFSLQRLILEGQKVGKAMLRHLGKSYV